MILGITGTIGAGKSTVCNILKEHNIPVVDADKIGHKVLTYEKVKEKLFENFGNVFDNEKNVDRKKLANMVFEDKSKLEILNSIVHPIIREEIKKETFELSKNHKIVACEIPLLYECGFEDLVDKVLVVYLSEKETLKRLVKRGMTEKDAKNRIKNQMLFKEKLKKCDFSLLNEENFEKLAFKVALILKKC